MGTWGARESGFGNPFPLILNPPNPPILNPPNIVPICNKGEVFVLRGWGGLVLGGLGISSWALRSGPEVPPGTGRTHAGARCPGSPRYGLLQEYGLSYIEIQNTLWLNSGIWLKSYRDRSYYLRYIP